MESSPEIEKKKPRQAKLPRKKTVTKKNNKKGLEEQQTCYTIRNAAGELFNLPDGCLDLSTVLVRHFRREHRKEIVLQGASNQNVKDIGQFLLEFSQERKKNQDLIIISVPVRSSRIRDSISPEWTATFTEKLNRENSMMDLLLLLHCATELKLVQLVELCLLCVASRLKGKSFIEMQKELFSGITEGEPSP